MLTPSLNEVTLLPSRRKASGRLSRRFIYDASVSKETISRIKDQIVEVMVEWQNRPLRRVYPVIFMDAVHFKIRDGQVANRPIYVAIG